MKITSRPAVKQDCEEIVIASLNKLKHLKSYDISESALMVSSILDILKMAKVIDSYTAHERVQTPGSTFHNDEWKLKVTFSGDSKAGSYALTLTFNFRR